MECAFAIIDENGNHITDLGNYYTNEKLNSTNKDKLEIWCRLDELSLNAGKYSINCWLCTDRRVRRLYYKCWDFRNRIW